MPLPQIAVDVAAPTGARDRGGCEVGPSGSRSSRCDALLEACTAAAANAVCVPLGSDGDVAATVLVLWRGRGHARIEVVGGLPAGKGWARELAFGPSDAALERWRSVGYAVGTLASEVIASGTEPGQKTAAENRSGSAASGPEEGRGRENPPIQGPKDQDAKPSDASQPAKPVQPSVDDPVTEDATTGAPDAARSMEAPRPRRWSAEGGASLGPGSGAGPARLGAFVRVNRAFGGPFVTAALGYSIRPEDSRGVSVRFISPSVGGGLGALAGSWLSVQLRAEVVVEQLRAEVDDPTSARNDAQGRWIGGLRAGAEFGTPPGAISLLAGAEATLRTSRTDIQVGNAASGTIPMVDYLFLAGLRAEWP